MDSPGTIIVLGIIAAILLALLVPLYLQHRAKARLYEMLKQAQESSHPFSPDLIRQIVGGPPPSREKDIRRGAVLLATAVGIAIPTVFVFALITSLRGQMFEEILPRGSDILMFLGVFAMIGAVISVLGCVGVTLLVLGLTRRRPDNLPARDLPAKD